MSQALTYIPIATKQNVLLTRPWIGGWASPLSSRPANDAYIVQATGAPYQITECGLSALAKHVAYAGYRISPCMRVRAMSISLRTKALVDGCAGIRTCSCYSRCSLHAPRRTYKHVMMYHKTYANIPIHAHLWKSRQIKRCSFSIGRRSLPHACTFGSPGKPRDDHVWSAVDGIKKRNSSLWEPVA